MKKRLILFFLTISIILFASCSADGFPPKNAAQSDNGAVSPDAELCVHYIDVGQGDSIFIELPDGETMLIDAGVSEAGGIIEEYITDLGYDRITYLVATHPHADHIGGMAYIVENFDIGSVYMPKAMADTRTFESLLEAIQKKGLKIKTAKAGVSIIEKDGLYADIVAPASEFEDLNNSSAVILLTYGSTSFLFTGDAEAESEEKITADIHADVLKVGHHGSRTSTSDEFLKRVSPSYAVISCGEDNSYSHPHKATLNRLKAAGVYILRTDINGNITFVSDGSELSAYVDYQ